MKAASRMFIKGKMENDPGIRCVAYGRWRRASFSLHRSDLHSCRYFSQVPLPVVERRYDSEYSELVHIIACIVGSSKG